MRLVNEPTAGAFAYALNKQSDKECRVLVCDFRCGTFDCTSLIRHNYSDSTDFIVKSTKGNALLGGEGINFRIVSSFLDKASEIMMEGEKQVNTSDIVGKTKHSDSSMSNLRKTAHDVTEVMTQSGAHQMKVALNLGNEHP